MFPSIAHASLGRSTSLDMQAPSWCIPLRPHRASQSIHKCSALSTPAWHSLQVWSSVLPTIFLGSGGSGAESGEVYSGLSGQLGLLWLPDVPTIHLPQSLISDRFSCDCRLSCALLAAPVTGAPAWSSSDPRPASLSASSFPGRLQWPGNHTRVTVLLSLCCVHTLSLTLSLLLPLPSPHKRDLLSVTTTAVPHSSPLSRSQFTALLMATVSVA